MMVDRWAPTPVHCGDGPALTGDAIHFGPAGLPQPLPAAMGVPGGMMPGPTPPSSPQPPGSGASLLEAQMEKVKDSLLVTERHAKQLEDQLQKLQSLMAANSLAQPPTATVNEGVGSGDEVVHALWTCAGPLPARAWGVLAAALPPCARVALATASRSIRRACVPPAAVPTPIAFPSPTSLPSPALVPVPLGALPAQVGTTAHVPFGGPPPHAAVADEQIVCGHAGAAEPALGRRPVAETPAWAHQQHESGSLSTMPARLPASLEQQFELVDGSDLGEGSVAIVRRLRDRRDGQELALKVMEKHPLLIRNMAQQVHREVKVQSALQHPNILRLFDFLEDDTHIYMLLELAGCGSLLGLMQRHQSGRLPEATAGWLFGQVVDGVSYLHSKGCIHRDLKPDNVLLGEAYCPKVCDFGWCADLAEGASRKTTCGTLDYMAPEVLLNEGHGLPVDLWSLGVMLYELLSGRTPFFCMTNRSSDEFMDKVLKVEYPFPPWFSNEACHLVHCLLQRQPEHRWITQNVLGHPWITKHFASPKQAGRPPQIEPTQAPALGSDNVVLGGGLNAAAVGTSPAGAMPSHGAGPRGAPAAPLAPAAVASAVGAGGIVKGPTPISAGSTAAAPPATCGGIAKSLSRPDILGLSPPRALDVATLQRGHLQQPVVRPTRQQSPLGDPAYASSQGTWTTGTTAPQIGHTAPGQVATFPRSATATTPPGSVPNGGGGRRPNSPQVGHSTGVAGGAGMTGACPAGMSAAPTPGRSLAQGVAVQASVTMAPAAVAAPPRSPRQPGTGLQAPLVSRTTAAGAAPCPTSLQPSTSGAQVLNLQGVQVLNLQGVQAAAHSRTTLDGQSHVAKACASSTGPGGLMVPVKAVAGSTMNMRRGGVAEASPTAAPVAGVATAATTWLGFRDQTPAALRPVSLLTQGAHSNHITATSLASAGVVCGSTAPALGASGSGTPLPPFPGQASPRALFSRGPRDGGQAF
eukprot:CAMPEP_0117598736 /NCGR_PEP_ID=MMETSP0784-20121206/75563_1 /TAXON_ID=39447 /ORGANISM="" /LENGTH=976 /DNA_ID=CAMNT_0005401221 /DNA_START=33 /DNA_END=2963 /DNA_ORIENTATION=-